jgi:hypothetical protein
MRLPTPGVIWNVIKFQYGANRRVTGASARTRSGAKKAGGRMERGGNENAGIGDIHLR